jgi:SAM dependent carboxyl methyltransferase
MIASVLSPRHYCPCRQLTRRCRLYAAMTTKSDATHTMKSQSYQDHSIHQYEAHSKCQHLLDGALQRLAQKIVLEDHSTTFPQQQRRRHVVDCGSADGSNSMRTLQGAVWTLQQALKQQQHDTLPLLKVTFEEHPASDYQLLQSTLAEYNDWFRTNDIEYSILMKSFYEPLFEAESVDLLMCYICLHWLDTTTTTTTTTTTSSSTTTTTTDSNKGIHNKESWKSLAPTTACTNSRFTFMNESTVPTILQKQFTALAKRHLAKFLALRARELKPGAEMILMMVSQPNDFVLLPSSKSSIQVSMTGNNNNATSALLTKAMQRCVGQGLLREHVLEQTLVPYYLRTTQDVQDALELAATLVIPSNNAAAAAAADAGTANTGSSRPGALLALVGDVETYSVRIGGHAQKDGGIQAAFEMFWSIHAGAVEGAGGATDAELEAVRRETQTVFHEVFSPQEGVNITFLACLIRKKTRESWSSAASQAGPQMMTG